MPDHQRPSLSRSRSLGLGSLSIVALLSVSVGLAQTVWGGPPAEPPAAAEDPSEALAGDDLGADPTASAAPEEIGDLLEDPGPALLDEAAATVPAASSLRAKMEAAMATIGELAVDARNDEDLVRATCVLDKQERANDVMALGTSELLVIRDPGTSAQSRDFALEKLDAAALRIDTLVDEAKACSGQEGPEAEVNITRNEADEPSEIPLLDPSLGLGANPVPPPLDGGWPPAASPIE